MSRLAKLNALFQEGSMLTIDAPDGQQVRLWINKLSPFEQEQANHEGRVARARRMLAIREVGTPEYDLFQASSAMVSITAIIEAMVNEKGSEHLLSVLREIRADPEWSEKVEVLEHTDALPGDSSDPEVILLSRIMTQYASEVDARVQVRAKELREDLAKMDPEDVRSQHRESYIEEQGRAAFAAEVQRNQVYFSMRTCVATPVEHGWSHQDCQHSVRWLESLSEVDALPLAVLAPVLQEYQRLMLPPDVARFTDALASSSDSSESSSNAGASKESGPAETPIEPVTTSS